MSANESSSPSVTSGVLRMRQGEHLSWSSALARFWRLGVITALCCVLLERSAWSATFPVTSTADSGAGSLRDAISQANATPGDDILGITATGVINLASALPDLSSNMTLQGPGAANLTVRRNTGGTYRIFMVSNGATVVISGLTISNGSGTHGGGIYTQLGCSLTVSDSTISGNSTTTFGGGISPTVLLSLITARSPETLRPLVPLFIQRMAPRSRTLRSPGTVFQLFMGTTVLSQLIVAHLAIIPGATLPARWC